MVIVSVLLYAVLFCSALVYAVYAVLSDSALVYVVYAVSAMLYALWLAGCSHDSEHLEGQLGAQAYLSHPLCSCATSASLPGLHAAHEI